MAILQVRVFGDPVLRQRANEVEVFDERLAKLAADMHETMLEAPGVGLAAPQVGVLKRLFTWELDEEHRGAVVNPVVADASEELVEDDEGCLSFPGLFYPVERPLRVRIDWQDLHGEDHSVELDDFAARVWLHELDHLNGVLFIDHLAKHDRKEAMKRMREYRLQHGIDAPGTGKVANLLLGRRDG